MEKLLLPSTIKIEEGDSPHKGRIIVTPCYHGYGTTLGNAFRRVLLSSLPGAAVTAVKIRGAQHEFSTVEGVKEDVMEIVLNLKNLRMRVFSDEAVVVKLTAKGVGPVTADKIEATSDVEVVTPDLVIANITDDKTELDLEITVGQGRGYVPVEERENETLDIGTIAIDAIYTPVQDVGYSVEFTRVGDVTNYEQLVLNIETDGTITPKEALLQSLEILTDHLRIVQGGVESDGLGLEDEEAPSVEELEGELEGESEGGEEGVGEDIPEEVETVAAEEPEESEEKEEKIEEESEEETKEE